MFSQEYWDERYSGHRHVWSGRANAQLVARAGALEPERAIDVGCGEGGDALWLAGRGWTVDLVNSQYIHFPPSERARSVERLAGWWPRAAICWW